MIEAIQVAALDVAAHTGPAGAAMAPQQAGAIDVRDFAQALQRTGGATSGPDAAAAPQAVQDPAKAEPSEGARMMISAFDSLNSGAKNIEALSKAMSGTQDLTPSQVLEMTMKCHEFLFQSQLTSNVANRTSDGVQQLFRQQS